MKPSSLETKFSILWRACRGPKLVAEAVETPLGEARRCPICRGNKLLPTIDFVEMKNKQVPCWACELPDGTNSGQVYIIPAPVKRKEDK